MKKYAIGIGGTGCRCLTALIYQAALGLLPPLNQNDDLYIFLLDPDAAHGNVEKLKELIENYRANQENLSHSGMFKTQLRHPQPGFACSPISNFMAGNKLKDFLQYNLLKDDLQQVCKLFFNEQELEMDMSKGFRAHPSVGAVVMANLQESAADLWNSLLASIEDDLGIEEVRVFVFASIFGGTGAAGFPTLAELLRKKIKKNQDRLKLGGALILPYFYFNPSPGEERELDNAQELYAKSEHFLLNTRAALEHYALRWSKADSNPYNALYFLGDKDLVSQPFSIGGTGQRNSAHYIEMLASLAALDFFHLNKELSSGEFSRRPSFYSGPDDESKIKWEDLPAKKFPFKEYFLSFTAAGYILLDYYLPLLRDPEFPANTHLAPWYQDFFHTRADDLLNSEEQEKLKETERFFRDFYFPWLKELHEPAKNHLLDKTGFSDENKIVFSQDGLAKLLIDSKYRVANPYNLFWEILCDQKEAPPGKASEKLAGLLYQGSRKFTQIAYQGKKEVSA